MMASQAIPAEGAQYLSFSIAGEEYAIGILRVREILEYDTLTKVPTTPPSIRGVINLRGSVVPVVDLAVKFGLPESVISKRTCIVVVEVNLDGERAVMGVLSDAVSQVIDLPASEVEPPPPFGTRVRVDCLIGMGRAGRKFVLLLDIDKLLSLDELEMARQETGTSVPPLPEGRPDDGETQGEPREARLQAPKSGGEGACE
jgi:purine-binding chemotaxis protein CheW